MAEPKQTAEGWTRGADDADTLVGAAFDWEANRVVEVGVGERLDESMGGPGRVGPDQDRVQHQYGIVTFFVAERVLARHGPHRLLEGSGERDL